MEITKISNIIHDTIKTPDQLIALIKSLFSDRLATKYIDFFDAELKDEKLYIGHHPSKEGRFFE